MMSGHDANSIFFNKNMKIGRPEHSLTHPLPPTPPPTPAKSAKISFLPSPLPFKVNAIWISLLTVLLKVFSVNIVMVDYGFTSIIGILTLLICWFTEITDYLYNWFILLITDLMVLSTCGYYCITNITDILITSDVLTVLILRIF